MPRQGKIDAHSSHKNSVTLIEAEVWIGEEGLASVFPSQSNDVVVEHVEREALAEVPFEIRVEKVVPPLEEIPSVVELDAPQLGELVLVIFGAECVVHNSCRKDRCRANNTSDESVVLASDGIQDGRVESGHKAGQQDRTRGPSGAFIPTLEDRCVAPRDCGRIGVGSYDSQVSN